MTPQCLRCAELNQALDEILDKLVTLTASQLAAFRDRDLSRFMVLDKELELAIGIKERSVGAVREHRREHESGLRGKAS